MNVLVINAGSSSLKYQLFEMATEDVLAKGMCERIGNGGLMSYKPSNGKPEFEAEIDLPTHKEAIEAVIEKLTSEEYGVVASLAEIGAVGHRVLTGGEKFSQSVLIDDATIKAIKACEPLGPLHIPPNLMGIRACQAAMPGVPQVAVFDTAFHATMPERAYIYAIPYKYYADYGIRRYGYHGTSYRYVLNETLELLGKKAEGTKIIICHIGNGASAAAIKDGKCVDTTMGMTPLSGFPMGTRSGDIDPAIFDVLSKIEKDLSVDDILGILNKESGVKGLYNGIDSDFRDIEGAAGYDIDTGDRKEGASSDKRAQLALDVFCYSLVKFIGSYVAVMGGVDAIAFTAGIGENSPYVRRNVCSLLNGIGICIDEAKNKFRRPKAPVEITGEGSNARVFVVPTDEELVIARDTKGIVGA